MNPLVRFNSNSSNQTLPLVLQTNSNVSSGVPTPFYTNKGQLTSEEWNNMYFNAMSPGYNFDSVYNIVNPKKVAPPGCPAGGAP